MCLPDKSAPVGKLPERSTRMLFFIGGVAAAAWAALVPFAKARAALDAGRLGLLLLCLGIGSIFAMPIAGALVTRYGCRKVLTAATVVMCVTLPMLAVMSTFPSLAVTLFIFGAGLGSADCAFNMQAVMVEVANRKPLMSGFHGCYSAGGIVGGALVSGLLTVGAAPLTSALAGTALMSILLAAAFAGLLPYGSHSDGPPFALPRGIVLFLGLLCFVVFLAEGAMLDWSAVFLTEQRGVQAAQAGFGFVCFSLSMTLGRLTGDAIVKRVGPRVVVAGGGSLAAFGIVLATVVPSWWICLVGYLLVGLGCSNIVPVLFSAVGRQRTMPQSVAVPALTTLGYAGVLTGPAGIGFIARHSSLGAAFLWVAALMAGVAISGRSFGR
jgi:fucose permease